MRGTSHDRSVESGWHVALVVENLPLGSDHRLRKQVDDLLSVGHQVTVLTMRDDGNAPYRGRRRLRLLEFPPLPQGSGVVGYVAEYAVAFFWVTVLVARVLVRRRPDVVQFCQPPDIYFSHAWVLRRLGVRVVVDQRDLMPELLASRYAAPPRLLTRALHALEWLTQRTADATLTVNGCLQDRLYAAGARPGSVSVVVNGPVLARCSASPDPAVRNGHQRLAVWVGKMGRQDRVDLVVRLADELVHRRGRTDCGFLLIGDGECLDELRSMTTSLGLDEFVAFAGWLPESSVFAALATADIGLDTSLQVEVTPVKVLEYMAFSLPVACFDLDQTRVLAEGGAVFAPPGDVAALAASVERLLDDRVLCRRLGEEGRRHVEQELAWEQQRLTYLQVMGPDPSDSPRGDSPSR